MALIDKLQVKNYSEYQDLLKWAIEYCPKVLRYIYDINITADRFKEKVDEFVRSRREEAKNGMDAVTPFTTEQDAISKLQEFYMRKYRAALTENDAKLVLNQWFEVYRTPDDEIAEFFTMSVMNAPTEIDRILKWRCPIPFVRRYLHTQCGVNPKWEWLYKIFWKGRKYYGI